MRKASDGLVRFKFQANVVYWRGPAPFLFAPVPQQHVERLKLVAKAVTYGWGMIPVEATIGSIAFKTSLFPKDGTYFLPIKTAVSRQAKIAAGDAVDVTMAIQGDRL